MKSIMREMEEWHLLDNREVLPFRFRKITAMIGRKAIALDRFFGKKIKSYTTLFAAMNQLAVERQQNISRVFFSLNEFSNADQLRDRDSMRNNGNRLLRSWMVIESDYDLQTAIHLYRTLYQQLFDKDLADRTVILSTGSRSLHFIIPFQMEKYLNPDQKRKLTNAKGYNPKLLHWLEIKARKQFLYNYLDLGELARLVDTRVGFDLLRQIPVPYTFYFRVKKFITPLDYTYLFSDPVHIFAKCALLPTDNKGHVLLDSKIQNEFDQQMTNYTQGGQAVLNTIVPDR